MQKAEGEDYEQRTKNLKGRYNNIDPNLFDVLCHIKDMTRDKVHEPSWDKWDSPTLNLFIETLKIIFCGNYVYPDEQKQRSNKIQKLLGSLKTKTKAPDGEEEDEIREY